MGAIPNLFPGILDLPILKALTRRRAHGYGIAQPLRQVSEGVLGAGEGSLYPTLHRRMLSAGRKAEWGDSENKRRARHYTLTPAEPKQLPFEDAEYRQIGAPIPGVLNTA